MSKSFVFIPATGGTQVTSSTTVSTTTAHTLYAHWTESSFDCACLGCETEVDTEGEWCYYCSAEQQCPDHSNYCILHCLFYHTCACEGGCTASVDVYGTLCYTCGVGTSHECVN